MADNKEKQETVKYKFGLNDIDLTKYIYNLGTNVQSYMDSKNWNDNQRLEFMSAYNLYLDGLKEQLKGGTNRFRTDDFGTIIDSTGALTGKDNDGIDTVGSEYYYDDKGNRITTDDYNLLKDRKKNKYKTFQANREVATYFNKVGKAIGTVATEKPKEKEKFDLNKHGFLADWQRRNGASGEKIDLTPYLDMDTYDETTKKRDTSKRRAYLQLELTNYISGLDGDYDFEGSPYTSLDDYKAKLQALIDDLGDGWSSSDMRAANLAGIGSSFYKDFFTEDETPGTTADQKAADEAAEKQKLRSAAWEEEVNRRLGIYDANNYQWHNNNPYYVLIGTDYVTADGGFDHDAWKASFNEKDPYFSYLSRKGGVRDYLNEFLKNPYSPEAYRAMLFILGSGYARKINENQYYIPQDSDLETMSALIYEPTTRRLYRTFIGDIAEEWSKIKNKFNEDLGWVKRSDKYLKEGGIIEKFQIGGGFDPDAWLNNATQESLEKRAKKSKQSAEAQAADERKIGTVYADAETTAANPDTDFTDIEYARIGGAVADIASAITAFVPGAGTATSAATGIGSTLMNAYADIRDDGVSGWQAFKNFGINLGMDIAGLIPGGGFATKGAKILRSVGRIIPKVALALGAMSTFNNREGIMESLNKAIDNPSDMTVQDWQNMAQAFSMIGGASSVAGAAYGKKARTAKKELAAATNSDKVALDIMQGGKKKTILFTGDDATAIRTARDSNDSESVNSILKKYDGTKDATIATDFSLGITKGKKWYKPGIGDTGKGNMAIHDIITDGTGAYIQRGKWTGDTRITRHNMPEMYGRKSQTTAALDAAVAKREKEIVDLLMVGSNREVDLQTRVGKQIAAREKLIADTTSSIGGRTSKGLLDQIDTILKNRISDADYDAREAALGVKKSDLAVDENALSVVESQLKGKLSNRDRLKLEKQRDALIRAIDSQKKYIAGEEKWLSDNSLASIDDLKKLMNEVLDLNKNLNKYNTRLSQLREFLKRWDNSRTSPFISREYNEFIAANTNADGRINMSDARGNTRTLDEFNEILKNAGLKFKEGGSLNISEVRKFQQGGKKTNTSSTANWFDDMYNSNEMLKWLSTFNVDNFEDFNNLQRSWESNLRSTGYSRNTPKVSYSLNVFDRLGEWNNTGTNAAIERAFSSGKITRPGISGDNSEGGYKDGYFGEQEYLRHGGTKESWLGKEQQLKAFQDVLAKKGLTYTLDEKTGMYLMGKLPESVTDSLVLETPQELETPQINNSEGQTPVLKQLSENGTKVDGNYLNNVIMNNPTLRYGLPRALYANWINRKMTNMAIAAERPLLQDPFEVHRSILSDLDAEMQGQRAAGQLSSMANRPLTSDGNLQTAAQMEAQAKGLDFINKGREASNQRLRATAEQAWLQEKENAKNRHDVAMLNRLTMLQSASNKSKYEQAYLAKKHETWDTFAKLLEYEARTKQLENKALTDNFARSDIHNAVTNDLRSYAPDLSEDAISAWESVVSGATTVSELSKDPAKYQAYMQAFKRASEIETEQLREYYNIPTTRWSGIRAIVRPKSEIITSDVPEGYQVAKNGGVLVAGIKAKTADAERFLKNILESIKRNEKVLDRLSKSLYGYIKASMVK